LKRESRLTNGSVPGRSTQRRHPQTLSKWIEECSRTAAPWVFKRLSANDTGATGGHQRALVIGNRVGQRLFPELLDGRPNPSRPLPFRLASHSWECHDARARYYNQRGKNEFHLTGISADGSPIVRAEATGRVFVLAVGPATEASSAWLCRTEDEERIVERLLGHVEPRRVGLFVPARRGRTSSAGSTGEVGSVSELRVSRPRALPDRSTEPVDEVLPAVGAEAAPPDPGGTAEAFSQTGYRFEVAIADLIDNSIDAGGRNILVRFMTSSRSIHRIVVADDGTGMSEDRLRVAMRYGVPMERTERGLGKYGVGMKSASLSQCRSLSVVSQRAGKVSGRRWTEAAIRSSWFCDVLDPKSCKDLVQRDWSPVDLKKSGTLVIWEGLDRLRADRDGVETVLDRLFRSLRNHLGLTFHRFMVDGRLRIYLDSVDVQSWAGGLPSLVDPLDPFGYPASGAKGYPKTFMISAEGDTPLRMAAHIWPAKSKDAGYKLGGGQVAVRQGFYFFRNDRLIQAGGWNGLRDSESDPHLSLARVAVDLPPSLDRAFGLSLHKSNIDVPASFVTSVERASVDGATWASYIKLADDVYRNANKAAQDRVAIPVPGRGIPARVRSIAVRSLAEGSLNTRSVNVVWRRLRPGVVVDVERESGEIALNLLHRGRILGGLRASPADAPIVKMLIFLVLREHFRRERMSAQLRTELADLNELLLAAVKETPDVR
jgi:Histidine kinase-, DNA gyrase B-, and HSP90-like ATPase/Restriction endonuclease EcoRII, N-terminal